MSDQIGPAARPAAGRRSTLADYRRRLAQYKADADLQALHAVAPWVITWDDHESANDAWSGGAANHTPGEEGDWSVRRAAAQQAYAEWMPVRFGPDGEIYRRLRFGRLAQPARCSTCAPTAASRRRPGRSGDRRPGPHDDRPRSRRTSCSTGCWTRPCSGSSSATP